jgi:hypothetical protein
MRLGIIVIVLMILAFLGGYWPQHSKLEEAEGRLAVSSAQLSNAESTVRLCQLQDQLLTLVQESANKNYGDAATLSTKFFNDLRAELMRTIQPDVKSALQSVLDQRDAITAGLAKGDPMVHDLLVQLLATFRQTLEKSNFNAAGSAQ